MFICLLRLLLEGKPEERRGGGKKEGKRKREAGRKKQKKIQEESETKPSAQPLAQARPAEEPKNWGAGAGVLPEPPRPTPAPLPGPGPEYWALRGLGCWRERDECGFLPTNPSPQKKTDRQAARPSALHPLSLPGGRLSNGPSGGSSGN